MQDALLSMQNATSKIVAKATSHKNKWYKQQIFNLKFLRNFTEEEKESLYDIYSQKWDEVHGQLFDEDFQKYVNIYALGKGNRKVPREIFEQETKDINRRISRDQAYEYYLEAFDRISFSPSYVSALDFPRAGFKNTHKYVFETGPYKVNDLDIIPNSFPLKKNAKRFKLHKVSPRGTYIIDLVFDGSYLLAVNVNTRYALIEEINGKTTQDYALALWKISQDKALRNNPIRIIIGDGEKAFKSELSNFFYSYYGIKFRPVPRVTVSSKSEPLHSSLSVLDRLVRTLRDMLYNARYEINLRNLKEMVRQYNIAPHSSLSKWIGFNVSPAMVQLDKNKEEYIVMKIRRANLLTRMQNDYDIAPGTRVKVYNEKGTMGKRRRVFREGVVEGRLRGLFKVNIGGYTELIPRSKLSKI